MSEILKIGILGVGNMGSGHLKNILGGKCPEVRVAAVADRNPERLAFVKQTYPEAQIALFDNAEAMLSSGLIRACMICVPHYDHPKYAIECLERGIHVMVEKPAGVYTKQVREMNAVAARHPETVFGMMFNQRTNPMYRRMHELVHSGAYGEIRRTNWIITNWYRSQFYYDSGAWRATWAGEGGGVLLNQSPHQLDMMQWICGMPKKVYCHMHFGLWHDIEVEDDVTTYMEYENGATGVFITTTGDGKGTNRFEIQLDRAKLIAEEKKLTVVEFDEPISTFTKTSTSGFAAVGSTEREEIFETNGPSHSGVVNAWAGKILHGTPLVASGEEGLNGVMLSNAMHLSAFLGREVELPFDEDLYYEELKKRIAISKRKDGVSVFSDTSNSYGGV